jgi:very-short-patch-repair endonuclease
MKIPDVIKEASKNLRNSMTKSEVILWQYIKSWKLWVKFLRQKPIYVFSENNWLDRFLIPDFYCYEKKLIIEIDGSIHYLKEVLNLDIEKEKILNNLWYKVIRITNNEINNNIKNALLKIKHNI